MVEPKLAVYIRQKIRSERMRLGYSQEYMASRLGMSGQRQYARHESGNAKLTIDLLEAMLNVLELPVSMLLEGLDKQEPGRFGEVGAVLRDRIRHLENEVEYLRGKLDQRMGRY
ncbi:MAG: helix-turn-helix transcriptional regulator [Bacteroidetes bacterium]|nr:helix-turn-helix transcriptional regulator [Bacteroidota bacterium]MBS1942522.1 helix-turn-helix transcriptional regulator [Bacteroidota bacterium]